MAKAGAAAALVLTASAHQGYAVGIACRWMCFSLAIKRYQRHFCSLLLTH